jgi:hypothetical protein
MMESKQTATKPRTVKVLMLTVTESLASSLFNWSQVILAVGAAAVLLGTIGAFAMGFAKEQFANERIAVNEAETASAVEGASKANARALEAKLALEKYKAPRFLTDEQKAVIASEVRGKISEIDLVSQADAEAVFFSIHIGSAFQAAGVTVHQAQLPAGSTMVLAGDHAVSMWFPGPFPKMKGLGLDTDDPLYLALSKAGMFGGFGGIPFVRAGSKSGRPTAPTIHTVYVGQKAPW